MLLLIARYVSNLINEHYYYYLKLCFTADYTTSTSTSTRLYCVRTVRTDTIRSILERTH